MVRVDHPVPLEAVMQDDVISVLIKDHREVEDMFARLETRTGDATTRKSVADEVTIEELRDRAWARLAPDLPADLLAAMTTVEPCDRVPELAEEILAGRTRGRVVVQVS